MKVTTKNIEKVKLYIKREIRDGKTDINYFRVIMKLANENSARACYYKLRKEPAYLEIFEKLKLLHDIDNFYSDGDLLYIELAKVLQNYRAIKNPTAKDLEMQMVAFERIMTLKELRDEQKK